MIASVEMPDGSYRDVEMGEPTCGQDFCDDCGDCLACQPHGEEAWCSGVSRWVIYKDDPKWAAAIEALP